MLLRRSLLSLTALILIAAPGASAVPKQVAPLAAVKAVTPHKGKLRVSIELKLPGVKSRSACKGSIAARVKLNRRKTAKAGGRLALKQSACAAQLKLSLPTDRLGKVVAFRFSFKGNSRVKKFSRVRRLKVENPPTSIGGLPQQPTSPDPPPPPPPPEDGAWGLWAGGFQPLFTFEV